jgi:hypothetical protein
MSKLVLLSVMVTPTNPQGLSVPGTMPKEILVPIDLIACFTHDGSAQYSITFKSNFDPGFHFKNPKTSIKKENIEIL